MEVSVSGFTCNVVEIATFLGLLYVFVLAYVSLRKPKK